MLTVEPLDLNVFPWEETLATLPDRTIYQSSPWMNFLKATQKGEPILAALRNGATTAGYFTGMIIKKFGLRILGSPFPGWSTSYMGMNLHPEVSRGAALDALKRFVFTDLHCSHLELLDRKFSPEEINERGLTWTPLNGFEVDLSVEEERVFQRLQPSC